MDFSEPPHVSGELYSTQASQVPLEAVAAYGGVGAGTGQVGAGGAGTAGSYSSTYPSDDAQVEVQAEESAAGTLAAPAMDARTAVKGKKTRFRRKKKGAKAKEPSTSSVGPGAGDDTNPACHKREELPPVPPPLDERQGGGGYHHVLGAVCEPPVEQGQ
ncbi:hypothetical protein LshimejAT787_0507030 [Lyophyllum shimeji]|uniref:Uncharacterized protein n=1 Tax=Lyophyllum shimeji TaxID=47721 RepID=A0A9P3PNT4_LYOSH|nr:hypothetical protein LshimejAT787_0507030 [Lyophyllum shimeji]